MHSINIIGKKFGRLTVIRLSHKKQIYKDGKKDGNILYYLCKCDCGKECVVLKGNLTSGNVKSCGCYQKEVNKKTKTKHGLSLTRLYRIWFCMINRCYNNKNDNYPWYGGKGITLCDEWKNDVKNFYNWSMKNGYKDNLTIDRIDVNGNYSPENCRWVDMKHQCNNRSCNMLYEKDGILKTAGEWGKELGIDGKYIYSILDGRIKKYGVFKKVRRDSLIKVEHKEEE